MSNTVKNILSVILVVVIAIGLAFASYNTFFKDDTKNQNPNEYNPSTDKNSDEYIENKDPYSDKFEEDKEGEQEAFDGDSFKVPEDKIDTQSKLTVEHNGLKFEFGIDTGSTDGIVLNPRIVNDTTDTKYLVFCKAKNSAIAYSDFDGYTPYSEAFSNEKYHFSSEDSFNSLSRCVYLDDDNFGIKWIGDDTFEDDVVNIRFMSFDTMDIVAAFNIMIDNTSGKFAISSIESSDISDSPDTEEIKDLADKYLSNLQSYDYLTVKHKFVEKVSEIYYDKMSSTNGYDTIYRSKINRNLYPMYAVTYVFNNDSIVTLYISENSLELEGFAPFDRTESLEMAYVYSEALGENPDIDKFETYGGEEDE